MRAVNKETKIKITKKISYRFEKRSTNNKKDLFKVVGKFCKSKFLLGIK